MSAAGFEDVWRRCAPDVLAALVRRYGDFDAAEDALQEALLAAARQWPAEGVPTSPQGWLITVAGRRLVDQWRSEQARAGRELLVARRALVPESPTPDAVAADQDDSLALLLLCRHPALPPASQVALTLRAVGGLSTAQVARAFLVPESTMAQRISRAKQRLRESSARLGVLAPQELPGRVAAVRQVLYLIFTEGHTSTVSAALYEEPVAAEAIRLTRHLHTCLPVDGEVAGLLALMLLTDARRAARIDAAGALVPLPQQDRTRWNPDQIAEGINLVERALPQGRVGPFQLQAAIAAVHADARQASETDWAQIEVLYRMLHDVAPGPVVTLNHAVAIAMVRGPRAALAVLDPLLADPSLQRSHRLHDRPRAPAGHGRSHGAVADGVRGSRTPGDQHPGAALPQRPSGRRMTLAASYEPAPRSPVWCCWTSRVSALLPQPGRGEVAIVVQALLDLRWQVGPLHLP